jgi:uncharacterized membrane protein YbjE (DUF340 family)
MGSVPSRHVRSRTSGLIGLMAVAAVTAALGVLALRAWRGSQTPLDAVLMLLMMAAGYLLADLALRRRILRDVGLDEPAL